MLEYLKWRGDLSMAASPFNAIDALIFSQLSYLHFSDALGDGAAPLRAAARKLDQLQREPGNTKAVAARHDLLEAARKSARFGGLTVSNCADRFDSVKGMQFAAVTFDLPDGSHVLAYRGTDATVVGWREDFNMSFSCPVPSQSEAVAYLGFVASRITGPLILCGHSKGGNLALYAAACCEPSVRERITDVDLFDAPGLDAATLETDGYQAALPKVRCYVPQTSIIGQLMGVPDTYTVVRSTAVGMSQHNPFTWALDGPRFATLPALDNTSRMMKATLDDFLRDSTPETRRLFVDTLFDAMGGDGVHTLSDVTGRWAETATTVFSTLRSLDTDTRKSALSVIGTLATSGMESARRLIADALEDATANKPQGNELKP